MTLAQLADFICSKVNQTEDNDVAAAKSFLQRRHEMLWNEALWKDSLVQYTQTLSPDGYTTASTWLPTKGILLCPTIIERVLAARIADRKLNVQRQEYYFRIDYDSFAKQGNATEFVLLPPCVWEWETAQALQAQRNNSEDADAVLKLDTLDSDGINVTRNSVTMANQVEDVTTTERLDGVSKNATNGSFYLGLATTTNGTNVVAGNFIPFGGFYIRAVTLTVGATYFYTAGNEDYLATAFPGTPIAAGSFVATTANYFLVSTNAALDGVAATGMIQPVQAAFTSLITLAAADLGATKRQRIRILEIPPDEVTVRVLGKRVCPTFSADNDEPAISGVTNCLLAFAQADMLQRERQYGKAQAVTQEAVALLDQLKDMETVQQAHNITIQPSQAYVSEWQFNSGAYSPLTF